MPTNLKCPKCGNEVGFVVGCPEYTYYEHTGKDWAGERSGDESDPIKRDDLPYVVICGECEHNWETPTFS